MKNTVLAIACVAILLSGCRGSQQEPKREGGRADGVEEVDVLEILPEKEGQGSSSINTSPTKPEFNLSTENGMQERTPDQTLVRAVRRALADDNYLARYVAIRITSNNGEVVLRGVVDTVQDKDALEKKVRALPGVKKVNNKLEVAPSPQTAEGRS